MDRMQTLEQGFLKQKTPAFRVGDTVDVHVKIVEEAMDEEAKGAKKTAAKKKDGPQKRERVQIFSGLVISKRHESVREMFTVRRIVQGEGVERVFPLHSPNIVDIVVKRSGQVRRAKLYYLRDLTGKASRLKEKVSRFAPEVVPPAPEAETQAPANEAPKPAEKAAETPVAEAPKKAAKPAIAEK